MLFILVLLSISAINIKKLLMISSRYNKILQRDLLKRSKLVSQLVRFFTNVFLRLKIIDPFSRTLGHRSAVPRSHPMATGISFSWALLSNPLDSSFSSSFLSTRFIPDPMARGSGCQAETSLIHPVPALFKSILQRLENFLDYEK